jgi:membrane protein YqaA with SNARE-associated domain
MAHVTCPQCHLQISDEAGYCAHCGASITEHKPVPKWHVIRRLYDWILHFAYHKHSTSALFVLSFAESSFFPIPPDVLLGPLCLGHRKKSMWFATVTTVASVLGAFLGYLIGFALIDLALMIPGVEMGAEVEPAKGTINWLAGEFDQRGQLYVFVAALTPIPFKLLTITAGFAKMNIFVFAVACLIGRAMRFYAVAALFWWVGPKATPFIDKYFNWLALAFTVLLAGGFVMVKYVF